jgi:hypothetical protein
LRNKGEKMTNSKQDIVLAVSEDLAFSDENKELEAEIAEETAEKMLETEKSNSKTINNLTFKQKVLLAANACIRHSYTSYDDRFIEQTIEQSYPDDHEIETGIEETNEVSEFLRLRRRKEVLQNN